MDARPRHLLRWAVRRGSVVALATVLTAAALSAPAQPAQASSSSSVGMASELKSSTELATLRAPLLALLENEALVDFLVPSGVLSAPRQISVLQQRQAIADMAAGLDASAAPVPSGEASLDEIASLVGAVTARSDFKHVAAQLADILRAPDLTTAGQFEVLALSITGFALPAGPATPRWNVLKAVGLTLAFVGTVALAVTGTIAIVAACVAACAVVAVTALVFTAVGATLLYVPDMIKAIQENPGSCSPHAFIILAGVGSNPGQYAIRGSTSASASCNAHVYAHATPSSGTSRATTSADANCYSKINNGQCVSSNGLGEYGDPTLIEFNVSYVDMSGAGYAATARCTTEIGGTCSF